MHVVIVGGGLGGLCLAQGLRRAGISVAVYERDTDPGSRAQGYRITVKSDGGHALHECLPGPLFRLAVATSIRPGVDGFGVHLTLREILLAGLDDVVHFGRTFASYESTKDGRVRAVFTDGSTTVADLPVGGGRDKLGGTSSTGARGGRRRTRVRDLWPYPDRTGHPDLASGHPDRQRCGTRPCCAGWSNRRPPAGSPWPLRRASTRRKCSSTGSPWWTSPGTIRSLPGDSPSDPTCRRPDGSRPAAQPTRPSGAGP